MNYEQTTLSIAGRQVTITQKEHAYISSRNSNGGRKFISDTLHKEFDQKQYEKQCRISAKNVRELILCNFADGYTLLTLTFAKLVPFDTKNINECLSEFNKFTKRLFKRNYFKEQDTRYIAIPEFHEDERVHFHVLNQLNPDDKELVEKIWGHGFIDMRRSNGDVEEDIAIANYLVKGMYDPKLIGRKKYYQSRNLKRPIKQDISSPDEVFKLMETSKSKYLEGYELANTIFGTYRHDAYYTTVPIDLIMNTIRNS